MRILKATLLAATAFSFAASSQAHVVMEKWEGYAGYQTFLTLIVPHGCGMSATTELRVKVPEGIEIVVPEPKPEWDLKIGMRKLDKPMRGEGGRQITEVPDEITWSGGNLAHNHLGRFNLLVRLPDKPNTVIFFKTIQKCAEGETKWIDTIAENEPAWKVWANPAPAPFVDIKPAPGPQLGATMQQIGEERKKMGKPATGPQ